MHSGRTTILHLAVDYNTPYRAPTTHAIECFVDELDTFDNVVIALRRSASPNIGPVVRCPSTAVQLFDMQYFGLPLGLGLHFSMRRTARRIIALLDQQDIRPELVHAHKFTFEGLAGWYVARHFGVPLFVSLRGEVETKVFRYKPLLRNVLGEVSAYATRLYFVSAWFEQEFHRYSPGWSQKERRLPNIVGNIHPAIEPQPAGGGFVAVLNLDTRKRKGLRWLLDAVAMALDANPQIRLDIIGGGSVQSVAAVAGMIESRGLTNVVSLIGPLSNKELLKRMPTYRALVLPSLNETFGMVFIEALFAGLPIVYTAGTAIDGYIDGLDVGIAVGPRDVGAISAAMVKLWTQSDAFKAEIATAAPALFDIFDPRRSIAAYRADVIDAVAATGRR
ncbi:hypothetical protein BH11PSE5_BH11PSE5_11000 [soil metagenome]